MASKLPIQILIVSYPLPGHINPLLRLAKSLAAKGVSVIFTTTEKAGKNMRTVNNIIDKLATPIGDGTLTFEFFDDGLRDDESDLNPEVELVRSNKVSEIIKNHADSNKPISCIINDYFFPWLCDVGVEHNIPCVLLWTDSCAAFTIYYNYVHKLVPYPTETDPYIDVELNPSIVLKFNEIPDHIHPHNTYPFIGHIVVRQFNYLSKVFCVLMSSYEELEHDFIEYLSKKSVLVRPIGSSYKDPVPNAKGESNLHGDIIEWLNTKPEGSVVYVSFGTIVNYSQEQIHEIAYGLMDSQVSFLWALKKDEDLPDLFLKETSGRGKVVKWCPQVEVLGHPSVGCFMTHCGWNSTLESLASGVPVVAFPAFGDQLTNAKFLVDVYRVGILMGYRKPGKLELETRDGVKKCILEATTGEKAEELKQNAIKWKKAVEDAVAVGGSSQRNLDAFIQDIKKLVISK